MNTFEPVQGRSCGACTLCCKVMAVIEPALGLDKPANTWCTHCDIGKGCKIYVDRPSECRSFYCGYLQWADLGEHWYPAHSKMVLSFEAEGKRLAVHVDSSRPDAWRRAPYYADLKRIAANMTGPGQQLIVYIGRHIHAILPDRDVDLGVLADDERILTAEAYTPQGMRYDAMKVKADDPRVSNDL